MTKDGDFVDSHLVQRRPPRLLLVATGNLGNTELEKIFDRNLPLIDAALQSSAFVELGRDRLVVHD